MTEAQQSLLVALEDLVEATRGFSMRHVLAADSEMERRDACTLSMLRSLFSPASGNLAGAIAATSYTSRHDTDERDSLKGDSFQARVIKRTRNRAIGALLVRVNPP